METIIVKGKSFFDTKTIIIIILSILLVIITCVNFIGRNKEPIDYATEAREIIENVNELVNNADTTLEEAQAAMVVLAEHLGKTLTDLEAALIVNEIQSDIQRQQQLLNTESDRIIQEMLATLPTISFTNLRVSIDQLAQFALEQLRINQQSRELYKE